MIDTDKFRHVFSERTRKIQRMSIHELNGYALSKEFYLKDHDSKYEKLLKNGTMWDLKQAIHLLVKEDPDDHQWAPKSGFGISNDYLTMKRAMDEDHKMGKLSLIPHTNLSGEQTFIATNIVFIKWAIDRGFNIPEVFKEYVTTCETVDAATPVVHFNEITTNDKSNIVQQLLKREAIKLNYIGGNKKLNNNKWDRLFENEKKNGLIVARISTSKTPRYDKILLDNWLIENAYFSLKEIPKLNRNQAQKPHINAPWTSDEKLTF